MGARQATWVIVLAAGEGTRLSSLTTNARGEAVPKQYCSLNGGPSLLQEALRRAQRIVPRERVCAVVARQHERHCALWNSFIFWARGTALLELIRGRLPEIADEMMDALGRDRRGDRGKAAVNELYERLPSVDFSRAVMQGAERALRVGTAPACGWTDLGTPRRVARILQQMQLAPVIRAFESAFPVIASILQFSMRALHP
jgi:mannose-1-phosphate guanylyltransferase